MLDWKEVVENIAPMLGATLNGPMHGIASRFIAEKLLDKPNATEAEIKEVILKASSQQLIKLKDLDTQFALGIKKLAVEAHGIASEDSLDASQTTSANLWPQFILSGCILGGYFFVLYYLMENPDFISAENIHLLVVFTTILGVLTAAIPQILNFWFGSSLQSKENTKEGSASGIKNLNKKP